MAFALVSVVSTFFCRYTDRTHYANETKTGPNAGGMKTFVGSNVAQITSPMKVSCKVKRLNQWLLFIAHIPLIFTVTNSFRNVGPSVCPDGRYNVNPPAGPSGVNNNDPNVPASVRTTVALSIANLYCAYTRAHARNAPMVWATMYLDIH